MPNCTWPRLHEVSRPKTLFRSLPKDSWCGFGYDVIAHHRRPIRTVASDSLTFLLAGAALLTAVVMPAGGPSWISLAVLVAVSGLVARVVIARHQKRSFTTTLTAGAENSG